MVLKLVIETDVLIRDTSLVTVLNEELLLILYSDRVFLYYKLNLVPLCGSNIIFWNG